MYQHYTEPIPSKQSVSALNRLLFFISDIRHGVGPLLSIHLKNALQWSPAKVGVALAAIEFSAFLSQIPGGLAADSSNRKRAILALACSLIIVGALMCLFFSSFTLIIVAQLLMGICIAFISPTLGSITMGLFGRKKFPARVGENELWNHCGNIFFAITAGFIGFWQGSHWIFIVMICFAISSLYFLSRIKPHEIHYAAARELAHNEAEPIAISKLLKRSAIVVFNISLMIYYMANGAQISLVGQILANKEPSKSALFISAAMIIAEITMALVAFIMMHIVNRFNRRTFFLIAFTILPIRAILYTIVENPYYYLLIQSLDGIAAGILGTLGAVINSDLAIDTGRFNFLQGLGAMSTNIGEAISQLFAGFIAAYFGFSISFIALAFTAFLGIAFFAFFMPETKVTNPEI